MSPTQTVPRDIEYAWPSDDLSRSFTATLLAGTQAAGYGLERLQNDNPAYPTKWDTNTFDILWDFGTATAVKYVLLVHHNFIPGLTGVTFKMGNTTGTTAFSRTFTIRDYHEDLFPVNEHLDLRDVTPTYRYARLTAADANVVPCAIGAFPILTEVRALDGNLLLDANPEDDESHPLVEHKTDVGVSTIYSHGTRLRWLRGEKIQENTDARNIRAWNRATQGRSIPFVLIPHIIDDDHEDTTDEESWIVRWEQQNLPRTYFGPDLMSRYRLQWEEVSRGLRPTPAAI